MNTLNENSYSDLIYRFMDGDADGVQQKVLFDALAKDSELQMEFQQAVTVLKGFSADKTILAPPARLTNLVFQSAGFTAPMGSFINTSGRFVSKIKHFAMPVFSAAVGALVTALVFFNYYGVNNNIQNNSTFATKANQVIQQQKPEIPVVSSFEKVHRSTVPATNESVNNLTESVSKEISEANIFPSQDLASYSEQIPVSLSSQPDRIPISFEKSVVSLFNPEVSSLNFVIEVRGMTGLAFFPNRIIEPEPFSVMNNVGAAVKYKFNAHHSAGLMVGNESLQMYSYSKTGDNYNFNHEPNLFWAGASYRYTGGELYGSFRPYGEVIAAGSKFGPIGKATLGISYNPENIFSMSIGLEGTGLAYKFLGETKFTEKLSVVYNIGLHF